MIRYFFPFLFLFWSCGSGADENQKRQIKILGEAQGTTYLIQYVDSADGRFTKLTADSILDRIDASLSAWKPNSVISEFNRRDTNVVTDEHFITVYFRGAEISTITDGSFQPFIGPLVQAWGFGPEGANPKGDFSIDSLLELVHTPVQFYPADTANLDGGLSFLKLPAQVLDVNGIAQGYSVDVVSGVLEAKGIRNYLVEIGGEVRASGRNAEGKLWRIGVDKPVDPEKPRELDAVVSFTDRSMATSGSYRKFYEKDGKRYSHTIDPVSGRPVDHNLISVTVQAGNCTNADAFATAFMVMGPAKTKDFIAAHPELRLEAYLLLGDGKGGYKTETTVGFQGLARID